MTARGRTRNSIHEHMIIMHASSSGSSSPLLHRPPPHCPPPRRPPPRRLLPHRPPLHRPPLHHPPPHRALDHTTHKYYIIITIIIIFHAAVFAVVMCVIILRDCRHWFCIGHDAGPTAGTAGGRGGSGWSVDDPLTRFMPSMLRCGDCSSLPSPTGGVGGGGVAERSPASGVAQAGNEERGQDVNHCPPPSTPFTACAHLLYARTPAACVAVAVCFEEKYSAVAGLVHAFDSWQRCVWGKTHRTTRKSWPAFLTS